MDLKERIMTRRSIRKFKPDPIPHEILEELLEAAVMAPNGVNLQPWYFVVLESKEAVEEFRSLMHDNADGFRKLLESRFPGHPEVVENTITYLSTMGGATAVVLAFLGKPEFNDSGKSSPNVQSVSAALENLVLMAWDKGIGSCWMVSQIEMGVDTVIEQKYAPGKGNFVASLALGYPDQTPKAPVRRPGKVVYY